MDRATRRLLFWLKAPYLADAALGALGAALLAAGRASGWWVLLFGAGRALLATIALLWLVPRLTGTKRAGPGRATSRRGTHPWHPFRRRT